MIKVNWNTVAKVVGHRDFPGVIKKCPCLDVKKEYGFLNDDLKDE